MAGEDGSHKLKGEEEKRLAPMLIGCEGRRATNLALQHREREAALQGCRESRLALLIAHEDRLVRAELQSGSGPVGTDQQHDRVVWRALQQHRRRPREEAALPRQRVH